MGSTPKRSFSTRLPPELAQKLEHEIAHSGKNQSQYIREIIEEHFDEDAKVEEESKPTELIEKMLEDLE